MKKIKKILAFVLSTSMLLGGMNIQAFAGEQKETNTANTEFEFLTGNSMAFLPPK